MSSLRLGKMDFDDGKEIIGLILAESDQFYLVNRFIELIDAGLVVVNKKFVIKETSSDIYEFQAKMLKNFGYPFYHFNDFCLDDFHSIFKELGNEGFDSVAVETETQTYLGRLICTYENSMKIEHIDALGNRCDDVTIGFNDIQYIEIDTPYLDFYTNEDYNPNI